MLLDDKLSTKKRSGDGIDNHQTAWLLYVENGYVPIFLSRREKDDDG